MRLAILLLACPALSAAPTVRVERVPPPKDCSAALRESLSGDCVIVSDANEICRLWLRKDATAEAGALLAVIELPRTWTDFKSQEASAGTYTLRYLLQPKSKDHEGTAPHRDFAVLTPVADDTKVQAIPVKALIAASARPTGGNHPVVMSLAPLESPPESPAIALQGKRLGVSLRLTEKGFTFNLVGTSVD